ncbi:NeuD/PglB/VioB family sugar acetyltransferase [Mariniflexile aquimaris]|uniref:NeuD/PglB/VioB family sugar acetyltransferase n=1 Tax=Mariniflexile aquimaris TaxID=881009 RepID=A0ABW3BTR9_9FLAO
MKNILIIGASGHAKVIIDIVEKQGDYQIFGLIDSYKKKGGNMYNYTILGTEHDIPEILKTETITGCIIAIGDNYTRQVLYNKILQLHKKIKFVTAIHPDAVIGKNVRIGGGSVIMAGAVINSDALIGKQCILNTKCSIDHDVRLGDFSSIAPGATLGGNVSIATCSAIGLGANLIENINIGSHTVVGAGSLVVKSLDDNLVAYGVPAKPIRTRTASEAYLGLLEDHQISKIYSLELVTIGTETDLETYNKRLQSTNQSHTFYTAEYCNHSDSQKLNYFLFKKNEQPYIIMPVFFNTIKSGASNIASQYIDVTSPYGFSGPLKHPKATELEKELFWNHVDTWYTANNVVTEFIRFNLTYNYHGYTGNLIPTLNNVNGKLSSFEEIWNNFKPKVRNNYRKAEKNKLRADIFLEAISPETIQSFYDIYIQTMCRNDAAQNYFLSLDYFKKLILNHPNTMLIVLVYHEDIAISTELLILNDDTMYSYLGGTLSAYFDLRPNDFLKIEMIKWGLENDIAHYALGGGRTNNDSLYHYKKAFFPKDDDVIFYTGRKIVNQEMYQSLIKDIEVLKYEEVINDVTNRNFYFPYYRNPKKNNGNTNPELEVITTKEAWQEAINVMDAVDFYHQFDYHQLSENPEVKPVLLKYTEGDKIICLPLLIRQIPNSKLKDATSVYGYSGPLIKHIDSSFDNTYFKNLVTKYFSENNIISVFSRLNPFVNHQDTVLNNFGDLASLSYVVNIDLTKSLEDQRMVFSKSTKRYLNKSRKFLDLKISDAAQDIKTFIDIYYENMNRVNARDSYYFNEAYFYNFVNSDDFKTEVLFATDKETGAIAAAAMMVKCHNIVQYHLSGTKAEYLHLSPIRFIIDEMRIKATQEQYRYFNLGGGLGNNEDELFKFKASFSKDFKPFKVWKYIVNIEAYNDLVRQIDLSPETNTEFFPLYRAPK